MSESFDLTDPTSWLPGLPMEEWDADWVLGTPNDSSADAMSTDWMHSPRVIGNFDVASFDHDHTFHQSACFSTGDLPTTWPQPQIEGTSMSNGVSQLYTTPFTFQHRTHKIAYYRDLLTYFSCPLPNCAERVLGLIRRDKHVKDHHPELLICDECRTHRESVAKLESHAALTHHAVFSCPDVECDSKFGRTDVMRRHYLTHNPDAKRYPCPHCPKYKGKFGFKRNDHLIQHLRNYHHIGEDDVSSNMGRSCTHSDCSSYRGDVTKNGYNWRTGDPAFKKVSDWTKHMKEVHDESLFPCPVSGCGRIRRKGYFRERDLVKHMTKEHSGVEYAPKRDSEGEEPED